MENTISKSLEELREELKMYEWDYYDADDSDEVLKDIIKSDIQRVKKQIETLENEIL